HDPNFARRSKFLFRVPTSLCAPTAPAFQSLHIPSIARSPSAYPLSRAVFQRSIRCPLSCLLLTAYSPLIPRPSPHPATLSSALTAFPPHTHRAKIAPMRVSLTIKHKSKQ